MKKFLPLILLVGLASSRLNYTTGNRITTPGNPTLNRIADEMTRGNTAVPGDALYVNTNPTLKKNNNSSSDENSDTDLTKVEADKLEKILDPNNKKIVWKRSKQQWVPYDQRDLTCWDALNQWIKSKEKTSFIANLYKNIKKKKAE